MPFHPACDPTQILRRLVEAKPGLEMVVHLDSGQSLHGHSVIELEAGWAVIAGGQGQRSELHYFALATVRAVTLVGHPRQLETLGESDVPSQGHIPTRLHLKRRLVELGTLHGLTLEVEPELVESDESQRWDFNRFLEWLTTTLQELGQDELGRQALARRPRWRIVSGERAGAEVVEEQIVLTLVLEQGRLSGWDERLLSALEAAL
ncbi:MAG: hypothetical protein AB7S38_00080 [Vulcanimicrobiota bacterium]